MALERSVKNNKYVQKKSKNQIWLTRNKENKKIVKKRRKYEKSS